MTLLSRRGAISTSVTAGGEVSTLNDLSDVTITSPQDGDGLILTAGTWENGTL